MRVSLPCLDGSTGSEGAHRAGATPVGIYLLNLFLSFLQPKFDPSLEMDIAENEVEEGAPGLPQSAREAEEFKPFVRRLPEFKFWYVDTRPILPA